MGTVKHGRELGQSCFVIQAKVSQHAAIVLAHREHLGMPESMAQWGVIDSIHRADRLDIQSQHSEDTDTGSGALCSSFCSSDAGLVLACVLALGMDVDGRLTEEEFVVRETP